MKTPRRRLGGFPRKLMPPWLETIAFLGCFRSLLLVTCLHFLLRKAPVADLGFARLGGVRSFCNILQNISLYQFREQLMREAPMAVAVGGMMVIQAWLQLDVSARRNPPECGNVHRNRT